MKPLFYTTGNHHLFLILKTASGAEWLALLGKRKPNFPFWGDRFENATFFNLSTKQLFHVAKEELSSLSMNKGPLWRISGTEPFSFFIDLHPNYKRTKRILGLATFRYHLPTLSFQSGAIEKDPLIFGHGFSEQGKMRQFHFGNHDFPFQYDLWLANKGDGGHLKWRLEPIKFIKDDWRWGVGQNFQPENAKVLAVTHIPLKNWRLRREIVTCDTGGQKWFGLKESFVKMGTVHV